MLTILGILIGLIFALLLFSMLSSTLLELIDALFSLRGRHLRNTLEHMLGSDDAQRLFQHPIFKQLCYAASNRQRLSGNSLPGWINKETFGAIVMDMLKADDRAKLEAEVEKMEATDLRRLLQFLMRQTSGGTLGDFQQKIEYWFEEIMQRATDWYRRNTRWWLFWIGIVMAGLFNADVIQIYRSLSVNAVARERLVDIAETFVAQRDSVATMQLTGKKTPQEANAAYQEVKQMYEQVVQSPLGLGWNEQNTNRQHWNWWLYKLAGLFLTGLAVTLGAQFWFDLLKQLLQLKNGKLPNTPIPSAAPATVPPVPAPRAEVPPVSVAPQPSSQAVEHAPTVVLPSEEVVG
jgi:hypothetical protein